MVMFVSLSAAVALLVVFFGGLALSPKTRPGRVAGALISALLAGAAWTTVVIAARGLGWVQTEEAQFHHLYVLGSVGLPLVGAAILVASMVRPVADRRARWLGRATAAVFLVPAVVGVYATNVEPNWLRVDRVALPNPTLPNPALSNSAVSTQVGEDGLRIAVIADVQTDGFGEFERDAVAAVMADSPDVILLAGDFTQVAPQDYGALVPGAANVLSGLDAEAGVYAISGNTDPSAASVADLGQRSGFEALDDEIVEFEVRGQRVRLLGLSWPNSRRAQVFQSLAEFTDGSSEETIDIVLAHSPDVVSAISSPEAIDLVVTGHTHGGQISIPFYGPIWNVTELPREVSAGGLHSVRGAPLYVSTGVGVQRGESPKVRFGVRPSVGILEFGAAG